MVLCSMYMHKRPDNCTKCNVACIAPRSFVQAASLHGLRTSWQFGERDPALVFLQTVGLLQPSDLLLP